jgi:hypothetical protein
MNGDEVISIEHPQDAPSAKTYDKLRDEHRTRKEAYPNKDSGMLLTFRNLPEGKDAYNPSGVFSASGINYIWARVESREAQDAVAMLFKEVELNIFEPVPDVPPLPLEDPFTTWIGNTLVVGGVEIRKDEHGTVVGYRTRFYKGVGPMSLEAFSYGPDSMKDIRLASYMRGGKEPSIFVFTRPYIPEGPHMVGRVAVTEISSLEELIPERLLPEHTEIIPTLFASEEWGGVNDTYVFENGLIGALAHVSKFDEKGKRHYAATAFIIDPVTRMCSPFEMIAERGDFPMGPVKIMPENLNRPEMYDDLADVIFSSRLTVSDGTMFTSSKVLLTCGLSDAAAGVLQIENPFPRLCKKYFPNHT